MGLINWWKEQRKWRQDNNTSWEGMDSPEESGLTQFQMKCLKELSDIVDTTESRIEGLKEKFITGPLKGGEFTYFIYEDGAEISSSNIEIRLERWDFRTMEDLIKEFIVKASEI